MHIGSRISNFNIFTCKNLVCYEVTKPHIIYGTMDKVYESFKWCITVQYIVYNTWKLEWTISLLIRVIGPNNLFFLKASFVHSRLKFQKLRTKFHPYDRHGVSMLCCSHFPAMIHPKNGLLIKLDRQWVGGSRMGASSILPETCHS